MQHVFNVTLRYINVLERGLAVALRLGIARCGSNSRLAAVIKPSCVQPPPTSDYRLHVRCQKSQKLYQKLQQRAIVSPSTVNRKPFLTVTRLIVLRHVEAVKGVLEFSTPVPSTRSVLH